MTESSQEIPGRVTQIVNVMGAHPADEAPRLITSWIELISSWNQRIDLTAARSPDELCDLMIADALVLATHLPQGKRVIDVGSGAGAPGLPLALLRPDLKVTLVEPLQKRVAFLRTAVGTLPASVRPEVVRGRGEDVVARGGRFDAAISRATLAPDRWLALGASLAPEVWVLLAKEEPPSLGGWALADDVRYTWPLTKAERRAVRFVKG